MVQSQLLQPPLEVATRAPRRTAAPLPLATVGTEEEEQTMDWRNAVGAVEEVKSAEVRWIHGAPGSPNFEQQQMLSLVEKTQKAKEFRYTI